MHTMFPVLLRYSDVGFLLLRLMVAPRQHWAAILCITSLELPRTWL